MQRKENFSRVKYESTQIVQLKDIFTTERNSKL